MKLRLISAAVLAFSLPTAAFAQLGNKPGGTGVCKGMTDSGCSYNVRYDADNDETIATVRCGDDTVTSRFEGNQGTAVCLLLVLP
jgi:hypothetical protein